MNVPGSDSSALQTKCLGFPDFLSIKLNFIPAGKPAPPRPRRPDFFTSSVTSSGVSVCNADESEPGTFKDRYLMEFIPHLLIEGMITSSYALGANLSYIYIRGEYMWVFLIFYQ